MEGPAIAAPDSASPSGDRPSYSDLKIRRSDFGQMTGTIVLKNNAGEPLTVMAEITLYNGDQTVTTMFGRADRVKPHTEQTVDVLGGSVDAYTDVAVDLSALP
jgi:hypothetical protein